MLAASTHFPFFSVILRAVAGSLSASGTRSCDCAQDDENMIYRLPIKNIFANNILVALSACLLLAACAEPVTRTPGISSQEIAAEAKVHEDAVAAAKRQSGGSKTSIDRSIAQNGLNAVAAKLLPAAAAYCQQFDGQSPCPYTYQLDKDDAPLNAYADGSQIVVAPAMIAFTQSPDELGVVLGHELAHNILKHPAKAQQNGMLGGLAGTALGAAAQAYGYNLGDLGGMGQQLAVGHYSQDFERDADYLGIYITYAAGYNVDVAPTFWQRMSVADPDGIYSASSHPTNPERAVLLRKAIAEIRAKVAAGQPLVPELRKQK